TDSAFWATERPTVSSLISGVCGGSYGSDRPVIFSVPAAYKPFTSRAITSSSGVSTWTSMNDPAPPAASTMARTSSRVARSALTGGVPAGVAKLRVCSTASGIIVGRAAYTRARMTEGKNGQHASRGEWAPADHSATKGAMQGRVARGLTWTIVDTWSGQFLALVIFALLARALTKSDVGLMQY